jgi:myo-inositol-1(or 4)-monophosphatase
MNTTDLDRALESAVLAVRGCARLLRRRRYDPPAPRSKPDGSLTTDLDVMSEQQLRRALRSRHPDHAIVGEECPLDAGSSGYIWYLDPLDGTRVYSMGQDNCCVAATLARDGVPLLAAVAAPFSSEIYTAVRGRPSHVNGRPVRVAPPRPVAQAEILLYYDSGEPGLSSIYNAAVQDQFGRLTVLPGSFILNCCRAARGSYDLYLAIKRRTSPWMPWDLAPAALVLAGAGGILEDLEGRPLGGLIPAREVITGTPETVAEVRRRFGPHVRDPRVSLQWSRRNEAVFARLCGLVLTRKGRGVVGIAGAGGGIGKTSFARELAALLDPEDFRIVSLDDYLVSRLERDARGVGAHDPEASDLARAAADLERLRRGEPCVKPVYDHHRGGTASTETVVPARLLIVEGVQALHPTIRPLIDLGVFLDAPPAVRYRRVARDMEEKGVSEVYARRVHERLEGECARHLLPLRDSADVVIAVDESFGLRWVSPA